MYHYRYFLLETSSFQILKILAYITIYLCNEWKKLGRQSPNTTPANNNNYASVDNWFEKGAID